MPDHVAQIEVMGSYAFAVGGATLTVLDVSDPANPAYVYSQRLLTALEENWMSVWLEDIIIDGEYAFIYGTETEHGWQSGHVWSFYVGDTSNPQELDEISVEIPCQATEAELIGTDLFVTLSCHYYEYIFGVSGAFGHLNVVDTVDPWNLVNRKDRSLAGTADDVALEGNRVGWLMVQGD